MVGAPSAEHSSTNHPSSTNWVPFRAKKIVISDDQDELREHREGGVEWAGEGCIGGWSSFRYPK